MINSDRVKDKRPEPNQKCTQISDRRFRSLIKRVGGVERLVAAVGKDGRKGKRSYVACIIS